jgi:ketosteroid isomerase-like protein
MLKWFSCALATLLLASFAAAQSKSASADVGAAVMALEEKWTQAQLKGDAAALAALLADTLVITSSEGRVQTKAEYVGRLKSGDTKFTAAKVDEMRVHVYGDTAIVTGRFQGAGTERGKPFQETERWTDTWIKMNGQWLCVASHGSLVKP